MFARITTFQMKSDKVDEAIKLFRDNIPQVKKKKGAREHYLLLDRKMGKGATVAFWDSEEDIIASQESGFYQAQWDKFKDFLTAPLVREIYEVIAQR